MSSIDPLSGNELSGLERTYLDAFREAGGMPEPARERVWSRLAAGPGPTGGEAANEPGDDPGVGFASGTGRAWWSRPGLLVGASVAVVSGAVVLGLRHRQPTDERRASIASVALESSPAGALRHEPSRMPEPGSEPTPEPSSIRPPSLAPSPAEAEGFEDRHELPPRDEPPTPAGASSSASRARGELNPPSSSLADERRLIEQAHAELAKAQPDAALTVLRRHAREFEDGIFVEEREALLAIGTCTAGQLDEGRAIARAFLASYPNAVLAARVRSNCGLEP